MAQSVCRFDVRVFFKQYRSPLLLPVGPFVGRLEQEITRAYKQFLAGVSIGIAVRDILLTVLSGFLHLIISLLHGIPTVFDAQLLYGITSQFLDMEAVDDPAGFRECRTHDLAHGVRQVKRDLLDSIAMLLVNPLQDSDYVLRFCTCNDGNQGLLPRGPHGWLQTCTAHHWIARIRR